ncbi:hypothetical protein ACJJTC_002559 [Scirpophaga incertulas]
MSSEKLSCVICNKNDDKVIAFVQRRTFFLKTSDTDVLIIMLGNMDHLQAMTSTFLRSMALGTLKARFQKFCTTYKADTEDEPFKKALKNCDPSTLPPCKAELQQHLLRTQYITSIGRNAYLRFPSSLTPNRNGWALNEDTLDFHWFDGDCIPQSVFDAVVHDNNKQNDIGNVIADDAEDDEADTDESEEDSDSSDEGASTDEE